MVIVERVVELGGKMAHYVPVNGIASGRTLCKVPTSWCHAPGAGIDAPVCGMCASVAHIACALVKK